MPRRAWILLFSLSAFSTSCSTRETASIDLAPSAKPPPVPAHPKPMPPPGCATDDDCLDDPMHKSRCDAANGMCVECFTDEDCIQDPMRAFCDVSHSHCVPCLADASCPPGPMCPKCKPMP
jgi:hypothetical protein